jgi:S1-C subfamily serine protease
VGILVDASKGLILTDRHSAPQSLGSVEVSFMGAAMLEAEVVFIHPIHNLAVLRCDTRSLLKGKLPLRAAKLAAGPKANLRAGEQVNFVGFDNQGNCFGTKVMVSAVYLPSGNEEFPMWEIPRFRERNLEVVALTNPVEDCMGGVLCDSSGVVRALYAAFDWQSEETEVSVQCFGVQACVFQPILDVLQKTPTRSPAIPTLDIEVSAIDVSSLVRGSVGKFPSAWLQAVGKRCARQGQSARALRVHRVLPLGAADGKILPGDVVLSVGGRTIACCLDIEAALRDLPAADKGSAKGKAKAKAKASSSHSTAGGTVVKVFREGREVDVVVRPEVLGSEDDARLVIWAGLIFRAKQRSFFERCDRVVAKAASGVFAQAVIGGSPAESRDFGQNWFLQEINGHAIGGLDDLLSASATAHEAAGAGERPWVRVRTLDLHGQEHMLALQCDELFFPTLELVKEHGGHWRCVQR